MDKTRLITGAGAAVCAVSAVFAFGCCKVPTPAQEQAFAALESAWANEADMSRYGAMYLLEKGELTEAGKQVLDARRDAFGALIRGLRGGE